MPSPHASNIELKFANLSADQLGQLALTRTAAMLQELDKIRRALDMPMEHLPLVIEIHGKVTASLAAEAERERAIQNCERTPLPMRSETLDRQPMKITHGKPHTVRARPQRRGFRPEDFAIRGDRTRWLVHDIKIGNRSQFESICSAPIPGIEFGPNGVCAHLSLAPVHMGMDLELEVEYVGPEPEGEVFEASIVGTATLD